MLILYSYTILPERKFWPLTTPVEKLNFVDKAESTFLNIWTATLRELSTSEQGAALHNLGSDPSLTYKNWFVSYNTSVSCLGPKIMICNAAQVWRHIASQTPRKSH